MNDNNRIGDNIRTLREAYGETQEELANAIYTTQNNISKYENGKSFKIDIITAIARRYMVTIQELMYSDLSGYKISFDKNSINAAYRNFWRFFPIFPITEIDQDSHFYKAYTIHKELYGLFSSFNIEDNDLIINIMGYYSTVCDYLDEYYDAYRLDNIKIESALNYIALFYFYNFPKATLPYFLDKAIFVKKISGLASITKDKVEDILKIPKEELSNTFSSIFNGFSNSKYLTILEEMMTTIHKSKEFSDLAQYYDALSFVYDIVDKNMDYSLNFRSGYNMLKRITELGNGYAELFLLYNPDPLDGLQSTI